MAISSSSSSSSSDNKVQNCSKQCLESFKTLQKNFDSEREKHNRAKLEIQGYELALESLESRILGHEKNVMAWGYGTQMDEISNKFETDSEISMSIFEVRSSDEEITSANDRFSKVDGYHVVPPPITGNFLTPRGDISFAGLDEFAIRKKIIESKTTKLKTDTSKSKASETVDDEDNVSKVIPETQTVKTQVDKIGQISKKEGIGFKKIKVCFVCKSTDHLIRDCDFHEKRMAKQVELNKLKGKATATSTASKVNTARPIVNEIRPRNNFFKSHSPNRRPFNRPTTSKANPVKVNSVNTANGNAIKSDVKGNWENVVKPSARCEWRPINVLDSVSKDSASMILKRFDYIDAHGRSKSVMAWVFNRN
ncbi:hypothetical protein Tco_0020293 [Tanacetum coccineum]